MSPGTILYLVFLILARVMLAVGGGLTKGKKAIADVTRPSSARPRFA